MRAFLIAMLAGVLAAPAAAAPREVFGYAGALGEWELTAMVTEGSAQDGEFAGPVTMKHTGICTQDGPEERTGEIRFRLSNATARLDATLTVAGFECAYRGQLANFYDGTMTCANRQVLPLKLWLK